MAAYIGGVLKFLLLVILVAIAVYLAAGVRVEACAAPPRRRHDASRRARSAPTTTPTSCATSTASAGTRRTPRPDRRGVAQRRGASC